MNYDKSIADCIEQFVTLMERPLPKACGKTPACRMAGGCPECFAEIISKDSEKKRTSKQAGHGER